MLSFIFTIIARSNRSHLKKDSEEILNNKNFKFNLEEAEVSVEAKRIGKILLMQRFLPVAPCEPGVPADPGFPFGPLGPFAP